MHPKMAERVDQVNRIRQQKTNLIMETVEYALLYEFVESFYAIAKRDRSEYTIETATQPTSYTVELKTKTGASLITYTIYHHTTIRAQQSPHDLIEIGDDPLALMSVEVSSALITNHAISKWIRVTIDQFNAIQGCGVEDALCSMTISAEVLNMLVTLKQQ